MTNVTNARSAFVLTWDVDEESGEIAVYAKIVPFVPRALKNFAERIII